MGVDNMGIDDMGIRQSGMTPNNQLSLSHNGIYLATTDYMQTTVKTKQNITETTYYKIT